MLCRKPNLHNTSPGREEARNPRVAKAKLQASHRQLKEASPAITRMTTLKRQVTRIIADAVTLGTYLGDAQHLEKPVDSANARTIISSAAYSKVHLVK